MPFDPLRRRIRLTSVSRGVTGSISALLRCGARVDPSLLSARQQTALGLAAALGKVEALQALLACERVECNEPLEGGGTPLCVAAIGGRVEVVEALLSCRRVDPSAPDSEGRSPLRVVSEAMESKLGELADLKLKPRLEEIRRLLLEAGAQ